MDIWDALTNPQTQATPAMIASLRNQNILGQLGQITGDKVISPLGQSLSSDAMSQAGELGKNALTEQQRQTQQQFRDAQQANYEAERTNQQHALEETMRHNRAEEQLKGYELGKDDGSADDGGQSGGPNDFQQMVKSIKNYDKAPLNITTKNPRNLRIMAEVQRQADQEGQPYDDTFYKNKLGTMQSFGGQKGGKGDIVRAADVLTHHLGVLDQAIDSLNNKGPMPWNAAKNFVQKQLGLSTAPTDFDAVKGIVSDELVKFILGTGAGGVTDREAAKATVDKDISENGLKSVVNKYRQLGMGQIQGLKQEYETNTRITNPTDMRYFNRKLSAPTRKALNMPVPEDEQEQSRSSAPQGWKIEVVK